MGGEHTPSIFFYIFLYFILFCTLNYFEVLSFNVIDMMFGIWLFGFLSRYIHMGIYWKNNNICKGCCLVFL